MRRILALPIAAFMVTLAATSADAAAAPSVQIKQSGTYVDVEDEGWVTVSYRYCNLPKGSKVLSTVRLTSLLDDYVAPESSTKTVATVSKKMSGCKSVQWLTFDDELGEQGYIWSIALTAHTPTKSLVDTTSIMYLGGSS